MMKRLKLVALVAILIMTTVIPVSAANDVTVKIDGAAVAFPDQKPYIDSNNRTLVPMRAPMEALGATVDWDNVARQAIFEKDGTTVVFTIGSRTYTVNGTNKTMDTQAVITGDRTCIPIRYAAEAIGATVSWDGATRTVLILTQTTSGLVEVEPEFRVKVGNGDRYMTLVTLNDREDQSGYKFRVECTSHPEFNTYTMRLPKPYSIEFQYDNIIMDDWTSDADWYVHSYSDAYDPPAQIGQVVEYTVYMKDSSDQIVGIWKGSATLSDQFKEVPGPIRVQ